MTTGNELVAQKGTKDVLAQFPPQIANAGYLSIAHFGNGYLLLTTTGIFTVSGMDGKSHLVANLASTPAGVFSTILVSPNGRQATICDRTGRIENFPNRLVLWTYRSGGKVRRTGVRGGGLYCLGYSHDESQVLGSTGLPGNRLVAIDSGSGDVTTLVKPGNDGSWSVSPDGRVAVLIGKDRTVTAYGIKLAPDGSVQSAEQIASATGPGNGYQAPPDFVLWTATDRFYYRRLGSSPTNPALIEAHLTPISFRIVTTGYADPVAANGANAIVVYRNANASLVADVDPVTGAIGPSVRADAVLDAVPFARTAFFG